jgi:hypothetical protein
MVGVNTVGAPVVGGGVGAEVVGVAVGESVCSRTGSGE